jgi:5-dehydro-2-deoxygluconokinase
MLGWYNLPQMIKKLLILPFDHRSSFINDILSSKEYSKKKIEKMKEMIFEAFLLSIKDKDKESFAILVDEEYGEKVLKKAKKIGIQTCLPVEKSGQKELILEFGKNFGAHIDKFKPDFVKVLIRYNPSNKELNKRQLKVLSEINDFCKKNKYKIILELLVPPTEEESLIKNYDGLFRYKKTIESIKEINKYIDVDVWKLEGFTKDQWKKVLKVKNKKSKIIFLGRGENVKKVSDWMNEASFFEDIIGFAIGRTIFLDSLKKYESKEISKAKATEEIKNNFDYFVYLWEKNIKKNSRK